MPDFAFETVSQRRLALISILIFSIPVCTLYATLNLQQEATLLAAANALVGLASAILLLVMRRTSHTTYPALLYLALLVSNVALALTYPHVQPGIHAWLPGVPIICYLLLGPRLGLWMTLVFLFEVHLAYLYSARLYPEYLSVMALANVWVPTLTLFILLSFYVHNRTRTEVTLRHRAFRDHLTGVANRARMMEEFERQARHAAQEGVALSLILIDLDHFKQINDELGHDAGDAALIAVAKVLGQRLRRADTLARLGGEEFLVLLPGTDAEGAVNLAEALRAAVEKHRFRHREQDFRLTLSAGVAEFGPDGTGWETLYQTADQRLYACKRQGRNCVLGRPADTRTS